MDHTRSRTRGPRCVYGLSKREKFSSDHDFGPYTICQRVVTLSTVPVTPLDLLLVDPKEPLSHPPIFLHRDSSTVDQFSQFPTTATLFPQDPSLLVHIPLATHKVPSLPRSRWLPPTPTHGLFSDLVLVVAYNVTSEPNF